MCLVLCLFGIRNAWHTMMSNVYARQLSVEGQEFLAANDVGYDALAAVDEAIEYDNRNPNTHYARSLLLLAQNRTNEAIQEIQRAVQLAPQDYLLWTELGRLREQTANFSEAEKAYKQAAELAPFFARPRWLYGNLLLRRGDAQAAFIELRQAIKSDPSLLPLTINSAWRTTNGDAQATEELIKPNTAAQQIELARLFIRRKQNEAAARLLQSAKNANGISEQERAKIINEAVGAREFRLAYSIWKNGAIDEKSANGVILNGGFEGSLKRDEIAFDWQFPGADKTLAVALDGRDAREGRRALRLDLRGAASVKNYVAQTILIEPGARYRLKFASKTSELVTGGLPHIVVIESGSEDTNNILAKSPDLPAGTSEWRDYAIEFAVPAAAQAVTISMQRQPCSSNPCPIFGRIWLDDFQLEKISQN